MEPWINPDDETVRRLLQHARTIAIVGLSDSPARPSYGVARYLQEHGYRIIPVNPGIQEVLGERAYPDLRSVPERIDIVDLFRRSEYVAAHVDEAIARGDVQLIWMQIGVRDAHAARRARAAGIEVVMNRCLKVFHRYLIGE